MKHLVLVCTLTAAATYGCGPDSRPPFIEPTPVAEPAPEPPPPPREIPVRTVRETITREKRYTVEAPADGTLAVRLSWDADGESGFPILWMVVDDDWPGYQTTCDEDGIAEDKRTVRAGEEIEVEVIVGSCWDVGFRIEPTEFVLEMTLTTG